jgi:general secretion pathway protein N
MSYSSPNVAIPAFAIAPWRWAAAGALGGLLIAFVLFAPARWLATLVLQASGGHAMLAAPRGNFWQGSAQLVLSGGAGSLDAVALPGQVSWRIRPAWTGLDLKLNAECCMQQAWQVQARTSGWGGVQLTLSDSQSQWPAALLSGLGTPWNTVQAQGQLAASTQGLNARWMQGRLELAGRLQLDALKMSSRLSTLQPMGSYRVTLTGGNPSTLELITLDGSLLLTGQGQWVGQRLRFDGSASATPGSVDALSNLLNIIGRRNGATAVIKVG